MAGLMLDAAAKAFCDDFVAYMNESCTAFHATEAAVKVLMAAGFTRLSERDEWRLIPGGKYFFTRNTTSLIAFTVGGAYVPGNGFTILGAHSDSPCLKVKAVTCAVKGDALMLNTQPYGGGLWHTWFDRDLGLAGRVVYKDDGAAAGGALKTKLVRIDRPIARIPNLAIHLTSGKERDAFAPNIQDHAKAVLSMDPTLVKMKDTDKDSKEDGEPRLHPALLQLIAAEVGVPAASIVDMELQLTDVQPSTVGGATGELIFSGRLDNLCSSYQIIRALADGSHDNLAAQPNVRMAMMFDHEEVGSSSCTGAGSSMFMDTLQLITEALVSANISAASSASSSGHGVLMRSLRKSLVVSIDMAHALHPNYTGKHDPAMAPKINGGLVIKHNANQRYATNAISASLFRQFGKLANVPVQEFAVRSDSGCGSTIGPIIATLSGILTVDCGTPQFSMHSIRETMGSRDAYTGYLHLKAALEHHPALAADVDSA